MCMEEMTSLAWLKDPDWMAPPAAQLQRREDGTLLLSSPEALQPYARCIGEWLERWAQETPQAIAVAERRGDGTWRELSWQQLREQVGRIAQSLLDMQLPADAPVVILSDNSIDHLLIALATQHIGRASCTVSSAYCRLSKEYSKVHGMLRTLAPALIYANDTRVYGEAMASCGLDVPLVFSEGAEQLPGALPFAQLLQSEETPAV